MKIRLGQEVIVETAIAWDSYHIHQLLNTYQPRIPHYMILQHTN